MIPTSGKALATIAALAAAVLVAACTSKSNKGKFEIPPGATGVQVNNGNNEPIAYANRTIIFYEPQHGTQIEYFAANGDVWLWYPGNSRSLAGQFKLEGRNICFRYYGRTYNPVTKQRSFGNWNCTPHARHKISASKACSGDPFNLASNKIPFVLSKASNRDAKVTSRCDGAV